MRSTFFWLLAFGGFAAVSLLCGLLVWPQLSAAWPRIEEKIDQFRRQPPLVKLVLLLFVGAFVVYGSTKTNGVDQTSGTNEIVRLFGLFDCSIEETRPTVTPEDIARGWQLWEVRTNCNVSYTMPEGATLASNWWVRGAFEDCSIVRLGDCSIGGYVSQSNNLNNPNNQTMSFPFGTNEYSSLWAFSWGKLRFELGNTNTEIVAVGVPMSAVPYRSRLWSAADTNGSRLVTWENFVLGRASVVDYQLPSTNYQLVSAQVELRTTGDFIVRSNEIEKVYHRIDDFDWDGDGIRNGIDWNPYWYDGDFTGQEPWWREYVDETVGTGLENGYYKLTATFPQAGFRRTVLTVGWEEIVVAEPGEYVFLLEKGEDYEFDIEPFSPDVSFEVVDDIPLVTSPLMLSGAWGWWSNWTVDGGGRVFVVPGFARPGYCCWMPTFYGSPNVMHIGSGEGSTFEAVLDDYLYPEWASYEWSSDDGNIVIGSPYSRETHVWFYDMPSWRSSSLKVVAHIGTNTLESILNFTYGRHSEPQVYPDLISPNVVVKDGKRRRLQVEFTSDLDDDGGTLQLVCTQGRDKIALWDAESGGAPVDFEKSWSCRSFDGFECYIAGTNASESVGDVEFTLTYVPESGDSKTSQGGVTVVDYVSEPISSIECPVLSDHPYMNPCTVQQGRPEAFWAILLPTNAPSSWLSWRAKEGQASFPNGNAGYMVLVDSSSSALVLEARINDYDDEPDPIEFYVDVLE